MDALQTHPPFYSSVINYFVTIQYPHSYEASKMPCINPCKITFGDGFVPATTTLSHGQRSICADLLNSYIIFIFLCHIAIHKDEVTDASAHYEQMEDLV